MRTAVCLFFLIILFFTAVNVQAQETVTLYFFWQEGCSHCHKEKLFLEEMKTKYPNLIVRELEISKSKQNLEILKEVAKSLKINVSGVPFTVIGDRYFVGWQSAETTGRSLIKAVEYFSQQACPDVVSEAISRCQEAESPKDVVTGVKFPLLGQLDIEKYSLPVLAIILGIFDGFNPCAMWVLIFLIGLLIGIENKRRRWILGLTFIVASAAVYFVFMSAWLNLLLFLGFIVWVRIAIGVVALAGGFYNLKEYRKGSEACKVTASQKRKLVFEKLKKIASHNSFLLALGGIILLAFAVNLVELICSAGLPAVFTQVLALSELSSGQYYGYILLYVFFFMLDDLFVFLVAMLTLQVTSLTGKYRKYSHLVGGIIMIILGLLLIFKHEWLMFG